MDRRLFAISVLTVGGLSAAGIVQPLPAAEDPVALAAERVRVQQRFPEAFAPITDVEGLPRVLLIGDSISIGYTAPLRRLLAGTANVHRVPENGGSTSRGLQQLDAWLGDGNWDVIHFNFGLHDIAHRDGLHPAVSPGDYENNLRTLVPRLRATGARVIFATTTPIPAVPDGPSRDSADAIAYNAIAERVMHELGVPVNDLYEFVLPRIDLLQRPSNVHFTPTGYDRLAEVVARAIRPHLADE